MHFILPFPSIPVRKSRFPIPFPINFKFCSHSHSRLNICSHSLSFLFRTQNKKMLTLRVQWKRNANCKLVVQSSGGSRLPKLLAKWCVIDKEPNNRIELTYLVSYQNLKTAPHWERTEIRAFGLLHVGWHYVFLVW